MNFLRRPATSSECSTMRERLEEFVDGALLGADRFRVSQHLETCERCADEVATLGEIGDALRQHTLETAVPRQLVGFAGGIFVRTRAESAESWKGLLGRGLADWHWTIVGAGSAAATCISTLFVSMILALGPQPARGDSLSGLMNTGLLYVYTTPVSLGRDILLRMDNSGVELASTAPATEATYQTPTEAELVDALADVLTRKGRIVALGAMHPADRRYAEDLLEQISRKRLGQALPVGAVNVHEFRIVTSSRAKAL